MKQLIFALSLLIIGGCVTQKKYNELLAEKVQLEGDLTDAEDSLSNAVQSNEQLEARLEELKSDTTELGTRKRKTEVELAGLQSEYEKLETYYNNLLNNSGKLNKDLEEQRNQLLALKQDLDATQEQNQRLAEDLEEREKKVQELEDVLAKKDEAVNMIRQKLNSALLNFKESDLTVSVKNGKVYVSLAEQLLFKSGSVLVDPKGKEALKKLAEALQGQEDIEIMVEGHTDNVPISRTSQYMNDNWDLSVMRATSIVRILITSGLSADQVIASGKGEFSPVDSNDTAEGRSKNRRTEIVITPDLDELYNLLNN